MPWVGLETSRDARPWQHARVTLAAAAALVLVAQVSAAPRAVELNALLDRMVELSPELTEAMLAVRAAHAEERRARAPFDWRLSGEALASQSVYNAPDLGQVLQAAEVRESLLLEKGFSTGTRASLSQRFLHGNQPNAIRPLEELLGLSTPDRYSYDVSTLTLTVTQPLLRGGGPDAALAASRAALRGLDAARLRRLEELACAAVRAAAAYYALYVKEQEVQVAARAAERDAQELALTRKRIDLGIVPSSDLVRLQQSQVVRAERALAGKLAAADAERALRAELGWPTTGEPPIATVVSEVAKAPAAGPARAASAAAAHNPGVLAARQEVERRRERLKHLQDAARPALDLSAFAGTTGFDLGSPDGALLEMARVQHAVYGVGLTLSVPLDNATAQADVQQATAELQRAEAALRRAEQEASRAAVAAAEAAENAAARLELAARSVALAKEALAAEQNRYGQGRGTLFDVLTAENAVSDAERRHAQVQADLLLARFSLSAVTGDLSLRLAGVEP